MTGEAARNAKDGAAARDAVRTDPQRLAAVRATGLIDTDVEEVFDRLTRLAVRLVRAPASFISLVDENRDFYKSACGFGEPLASSRELTGLTFCHYAVQRTTPLVIPDTAADPVYREVPTVKSLGVAAYVGVPLVIQGQVVGAFCTIDMKPRQWTADDVEVLSELAASAQREIELRGALAVARSTTAVLERQRTELERSNHLLQDQAVELEMQAEELHAIAAQLEDRTDEAERANVAKSRFLSMMSHELRTPLNAIGGYAELLLLGVRGPVTAEQEDYLKRITRAGLHLQTIISEILEFTRLSAGQAQFVLSEMSVAGVVGEALDLVASLAAEREIVVDDGGGASSDLRVRADAPKVRQVLINLLTNALKFTPVGGRVWMSQRVDGSNAIISVSDSGRGIPTAELERIFDPFVQIDRASTDHRHQGVGLGLSICLELARGMGGDLSVQSEKGVGSTFSLSLPLAA